jgi:hypothetical protein
VSYILGIFFSKTLFILFSNQIVHIRSCCNLTSFKKEKEIICELTCNITSGMGAADEGGD